MNLEAVCPKESLLTFKAEPRGDGESHNVKQEGVDAAEKVAPIVLQAD